MPDRGSGIDKTAMTTHERIAKALDIKDAVAEHLGHGDKFQHHLHAAEVEEVREMVNDDIDEQIEAEKPNAEALHRAVDRKDKLAEHNVKVSEEEELWHEEVDKSVQ